MSAQSGKVVFVRGFDILERLSHNGPPGRGQVQPPGAAVCRVKRSLQEGPRLELACHLTGHHPTGPGVLGEPSLSRRSILVVGQPPERGKQHELDVRQLVRLQHRANPSLPRQRDAPQQQARALLGFVELGARTCRYDDRSLARAISDAIVSGKSAVIMGPTCCA